MAVRKGYNRFFIIFQEEDKGYGIAIDKQPTGYAKIEVKNGKCKITVYAQNLKKDRGPYHFCMIDTLKAPAHFVKVGEVRIDEMGRGETWWEYNEDNIAESGSPIERFNVAIIVADGEYLLAPLAGYTGKDKIEWKEKIVIKDKEEHVHDHDHEHHEHHEHHDHDDHMRNHESEEVKEQEDIELLDEEGMKFRDYEEELQAEVEVEVEAEAEPEVEVEVDGEARGEVELNINRENELLEEDYAAGCIKVDMARHDENKHKHKGYKAHAAIFHELLEQFEEMEEPFEDVKAQDTRWWKIPYNCSINMAEDRHYPFLCTIFHLNMTYPHIDYIKYFHKKGYFYFGIKYDKENEIKYLMYGIEGNNVIKDQPYMGMTGFGKWIKLRDRDNGMWILFYNPRTGNFMVEKSE